MASAGQPSSNSRRADLTKGHALTHSTRLPRRAIHFRPLTVGSITISKWRRREPGTPFLSLAIMRIGWSFSWEFSSKRLKSHGHFSPQLGEKPWSINVRQLPLNQRVQGSSPCAPTINPRAAIAFQQRSCNRALRSAWAARFDNFRSAPVHLASEFFGDSLDASAA